MARPFQWSALGVSLLAGAACTDAGARPPTAPPVPLESALAPAPGVPQLAKQTFIIDLNGQDPAASALDGLMPEQTLWLDIVLPIGYLPNVRRGAEWTSLSPDCAHGIVSGLDEIALPSGSNHLILSVIPGMPEHHAANLVACEYAVPDASPGASADPVRVRVTGCFMVHEVAIPTARQLVLHPRAAEACGL
jgi:hypothetical protein